jgi:hypothetical protein
MNRRIPVKKIKEILKLVNENNQSIRQIAKSCSCSPSTVTAKNRMIIPRHEQQRYAFEHRLFTRRASLS